MAWRRSAPWQARWDGECTRQHVRYTQMLTAADIIAPLPDDAATPRCIYSTRGITRRVRYANRTTLWIHAQIRRRRRTGGASCLWEARHRIRSCAASVPRPRHAEQTTLRILHLWCVPGPSRVLSSPTRVQPPPSRLPVFVRSYSRQRPDETSIYRPTRWAHGRGSHIITFHFAGAVKGGTERPRGALRVAATASVHWLPSEMKAGTHGADDIPPVRRQLRQALSGKPARGARSRRRTPPRRPRMHRVHSATRCVVSARVAPEERSAQNSLCASVRVCMRVLRVLAHPYSPPRHGDLHRPHGRRWLQDSHCRPGQRPCGEHPSMAMRQPESCSTSVDPSPLCSPWNRNPACRPCCWDPGCTVRVCFSLLPPHTGSLRTGAFRV